MVTDDACGKSMRKWFTRVEVVRRDEDGAWRKWFDDKFLDARDANHAREQLAYSWGHLPGTWHRYVVIELAAQFLQDMPC